MNTPAKKITLKEGQFREWLASNSFAKQGDRHEQSYHSAVGAIFPVSEEFWRRFVVPLTNRMDPNDKDLNIHFRDGVDNRLQYICGASYSLFVHLALAHEMAEKWSDSSLDSVYARMASAFDVFEGLAIQFYLLICECRGIKSRLIDELTLEEFLKLSEGYYKEHYPKLHEYYVAIGKRVPPILIPSKGAILDDFFDGHPARKEYLTVSGQVRSLRNALVHDVRVGMLTNEKGELFIPKSSVVSQYRQWSKVWKVAAADAQVQKDFCEVTTQCQGDLQRSAKVINELFSYMLKQFEGEFYSKERPRLRDVFGIQFAEDAPAPPLPPAVLFQPDSGSGICYSNANLSGVSTIPPSRHA